MLTLDADGWLKGAPRRPSENRSPRPPGALVELAVVHCISLPPGEFGGDDVERLFLNKLNKADKKTKADKKNKTPASYASLQNLRVSAHFFIRRDGSLLQFVSTSESAWHAGDSIWRGRAACNDFSLGVELEGAENIAYAARQYEKLAALLTAAARQYPHLAVAGHADIAPRRKTDPGPAFDWQRLFAEAKGIYDGRNGNNGNNSNT